LQDIDDAVKELEKDVEEAKKKRDELKKDASLDPELEAIIDSIIKALAKMRKKVDNLIALEAKAKADREKARREAEEAAEAARKRAESEGEDPDKAAEDAARKARKDSEERVKKADLDTMKAAQDVEKEMKEAEKGAKKLDTGLHPHGAKWWRYRYERSYVEALIMIFISWLMLLWSVAIRTLKHKLFIWALRPGQEAESELEALEGQTHGAVYGQWLHLLSEQMMATRNEKWQSPQLEAMATDNRDGLYSGLSHCVAYCQDTISRSVSSHYHTFGRDACTSYRPRVSNNGA
jgi:hypothetical protein